MAGRGLQEETACSSIAFCKGSLRLPGEESALFSWAMTALPSISFFFRSVGIDLNVMAVEYATVLKEIRQAAEILQTGALQEVAIQTDHYQMIIRTLNDDYFIALTLQRQGNFGKGRYLLMRDAPALREALG